MNTAQDVVGFVRFGTNETWGFIDSIGIQSDLRGKRLGSLLLAKTLQGMADRGVTCASFPCTSAIRFYETVDAKVTTRYQQFEKNLSS